MTKGIVCTDSDYEDIVRIVADYRRNKVYPLLSINGNIVKTFFSATASRKYISDALTEAETVFFSASGHGTESEIIGNDYDALLHTASYGVNEVKNKIFHFLACSTAYKLGADVVDNGCIAFFGYDVEFVYYPDYVEEFFAPDAVIDLSIAQGKTAKEVHDLAVAEYNKMARQLRTKGVQPIIISSLLNNLAHLCSPVTNSRWGNQTASI